MSKIKNGGLDQYGAEAFEQQQFGTYGVYLPKKLICHVTLTTPTWGSLSSQDYSEPVEKPRTSRSVNKGPHICIWGGGLQLSSAGTDNGATSESCRRAVVCASTITIVANL